MDSPTNADENDNHKSNTSLPKLTHGSIVKSNRYHKLFNTSSRIFITATLHSKSLKLVFAAICFPKPENYVTR
jgi:hypothetical protein